MAHYHTSSAGGRRLARAGLSFNNLQYTMWWRGSARRSWPMRAGRPTCCPPRCAPACNTAHAADRTRAGMCRAGSATAPAGHAPRDAHWPRWHWQDPPGDPGRGRARVCLRRWRCLRRSRAQLRRDCDWRALRLVLVRIRSFHRRPGLAVPAADTRCQPQHNSSRADEGAQRSCLVGAPAGRLQSGCEAARYQPGFRPREVGDTLGIAWSLHMHALQAYYQGNSLSGNRSI